MSSPFIGEIRMFAGTFAPSGWAFCSGQLQSIAQNQALFTLIGTTYGGDGVNTFGLPDLRGRIPIHQGTGAGLSTRVLGQAGGTETVTVNANQIPSHSHLPAASSSAGTQPSPTGALWAVSTLAQYSSGTPASPVSVASVGLTGGSQPHDNMMPYLAVSFIISLFGIFPSQN